MRKPVPLFAHNMENVKTANHTLNISQFPFQTIVHKRTLSFDVPTAAGSCSCLLEMAQHSANFHLHLVCWAALHIDKQQQTLPHSQWELSLTLSHKKDCSRRRQRHLSMCHKNRNEISELLCTGQIWKFSDYQMHHYSILKESRDNFF